MNRGIARRTMFERRGDIEVLEDLLGQAVERGEIEVHAYCVLSTHYHLLARSPRGELSSAMQRVQTEYSRWFNRSRRRDGALVRGRFASKVVDSGLYRCTVVRYIDRNAVAAGIVARAADYPYGSARAYVGRANAPAWLEQSWVQESVRRALELPRYDPDRYGEVFSQLPADLARVVEARWRHRAREDPLDDLVAAAPEEVARWMRNRARLADGTAPGCPVVSLESVVAAVRSDPELATWKLGRRSGLAILMAGLARQLAGARIEEIAPLVECSRSAAGRYVQIHRDAVIADAEYRRRAGGVACRALAPWSAAEVGGK